MNHSTPLVAISVFCAIIFFFLLLMAALYRLAVRVVAGFYPGIWMVLLGLIIGLIGWTIIDGAIVLIGHDRLTLNEQNGINTLIGMIVLTGVYGALIKYPNGELLGFWRALISYFLYVVFTAILIIAIIAGTIAVVGKKPVMNAWQQQIAAMGRLRAMQSAQNLPSFSYAWTNMKNPSTSPITGDTASATPNSNTALQGSRLYLKEPITIQVAYGNIIIPAKTPVTLIEQTGDSCRVQFNNNVYTITRDNLTTQP